MNAAPAQINAGVHAEQLRRRSLSYSAAASGAFLGTLIGVVLAGPHFHHGPALQSLAVVAGGAVACGLLGYVAIAAAYGASVGGPDEDLETAGRNSGDIDGASGGGGGGGGGD